jgi:hypothetical protein
MEKIWWACRDSNPEPRDYESPALTVELQARLCRYRRRLLYQFDTAAQQLRRSSDGEVNRFAEGQIRGDCFIVQAVIHRARCGESVLPLRPVSPRKNPRRQHQIADCMRRNSIAYSSSPFQR